ncbi:MAG: hypothetical protein H0W06_10190 [Chloroflexia bacterium]|nr:hypothetical protein [Chloroflexia bacterium]
MLISDLAARDLGWQRESASLGIGTLLTRVAARVQRMSPFSGRTRSPAPLSHEAQPTRPAPLAVVRAPDAGKGPAMDESFRWRRHPQLRDRAEVVDIHERQARLAAIRGLFNARNGDYEGARLAFAQAAREDALDLAEVPGFWLMPRAGLTAAVLAYEDAGRLRDAAALAARVRTTLRPRPVTVLPAAETAQAGPIPRLTASGD